MQEIRRKKIRMKKTLYIIRDIAITVGIQLVCFMVCLWIQNSTVENALIPAVSISDFCDHTGVSVWCGSCNSQRS